MCGTLRFAWTIIATAVVAVAGSLNSGESRPTWEGEPKELLAIYNHSADPDIDRAIDEHWDSLKIFASTISPNLSAEQFAEATFADLGLESRTVPISVKTCISLPFFTRVAEATSVSDNIKKKILNNKRLNQVDYLEFCRIANCTNIIVDRNQVAVCKQALARRKLLALNPVTNEIEVDTFWLPAGCSCVVEPDG